MKKTLALLRIWLWVSLITLIFGIIFGIMSAIVLNADGQVEIHQVFGSAVLTYFIIYFINDHIKKES